MPLSSMDWYGRIRTWTEPPRTSGSSSRTFGRTMALKNALTSSKQLQILHFLFLLHFLSLAQVLEWCLSVWNEWNELGELGLYRYGQPLKWCHSIACVSSRMLPVACAATHGRPNVTMHDSSACQKPAPRPDVIQHGWSSCIATQGPLGVKTMPCRALGVMLHVRLHPAETYRATETLRCLDEGQHVLISQIGPPRASRLICAISVFLMNFRPAINPEYFSAPVLIL